MGLPDILDKYPLVKEWYNLVGSHKGLSDLHQDENYLKAVEAISAVVKEYNSQLE